ncbi:hypothetical protein EDB89DRAFT_2113825 [Lactarius sanguifluus]|nr:hypothetical protein EDB89DRAFT_2113825 [Lactarius sanguifluus]
MRISVFFYLVLSGVPVLTSMSNRAKVEHRAAFTPQNGPDAQALNRKFEGLTAGSSCTVGETACVDGQLAQCVGNKFAHSSCSSSLRCVALPLLAWQRLNVLWRSVTCDTPEDAAARIDGATGGLLGKRAKGEHRAAFTLQNGLDAQALNGLNRKFQSLTPGSACKDGEIACVKGQLGQCAGGNFIISPCAASLQCVALPLIDKPGTSAEKAPPACEAKAKRADTTAAGASLLLKRIAQTDLGQVARSWQDLCVKGGGKRNGAGGDPCVKPAGQNGIAALLANADPCARQDNADSMVDFAKSPGVKNEQALIANAVAYRKHPRNALNIDGVMLSTLFYEKAPRNEELSGVVNAQLQGVDPGMFGSPKTGLVAFGARDVCSTDSLHSMAGTCPFGKTADVTTCSC